MKITDVKAYPVWVGHRNQCLVKVETDEGLYGWGESGLSAREMAVVGAVNHYREFLIGRDPMQRGALWQEMYRSQYFEGGRTLTAAISAIDIALYDIVGKALGVPVYELLGGKHRDAVPCFATTGARSYDQLITNVKLLLNKGWSVIRIGAAQGPKRIGGGSDSNDDDQVYMTFFGTYIKHDLENKRKIEIAYPYEEAIGNVFISKVGADVTTTTASGESVVIQRISVGATKLASEVSDVKAQDAILVGGPCANAAAADAMGNPADCAAGFEEGKGLIQLVEHSNGKVAMIVAGYSADDTRNAATVIANYADYALSGAKMEVSKVGASITVASATE